MSTNRRARRPSHTLPPATASARTNASSSSKRPSAQRSTKKSAAQRRRARNRFLASALGAIVLAGALSLALFDRPSSAGYVTTSQNWILPRLDASGHVSLASFHGRPVVVNFFASWCTVCAAELPVFAADAAALKGTVAVVEVNALETGNGSALAAQYHLASHVSAVARDVGGSQGDGLYQSLGGTGTMPMTAFYDASGHLITTHVGGFDAASLAQAIHQIYGVTVPA